MSKIYLTDIECNQVEKLIQDLPILSRQIQTSATNIKDTINSSNISGWVNNTSIGQNIKQQITKESYSLEQFATHLNELNTTLTTLVAESRHNNLK